MSVRARDSDFFETAERTIFYVKGLIHPPDKVVGFVRYVPDPQGDRRRDGSSYRKIEPIEDQYRVSEESHPDYFVYDPVFDEHLTEVPVGDISRWYRPLDRMRELRSAARLDEVERHVLELAKLLQSESKVPWDSIGVVGSILVRLHRKDSDLDLIVYGSRHCQAVYRALGRLFKKGSLAPYNEEDLERRFTGRIEESIMTFDDFAKLKNRELFHGRFKNRCFYIKFVKDWGEIKEKYGDVRYKSVGCAKISATITDDSEWMFTPCRYGIDEVQIMKGAKVCPIREIVCFKSELVKRGEGVLAHGKVEQVIKEGEWGYYRMVIGGRPRHYIFPQI